MTITEPATDDTVIVEAFRFPATLRAEVDNLIERVSVTTETLRPLLAEVWQMNRTLEGIHDTSSATEAIEWDVFGAMSAPAGLHVVKLNEALLRLSNMVDAVDHFDPASAGLLGIDLGEVAK